MINAATHAEDKGGGLLISKPFHMGTIVDFYSAFRPESFHRETCETKITTRVILHPPGIFFSLDNGPSSSKQKRVEMKGNFFS
jgi:hypothetical protein